MSNARNLADVISGNYDVPAGSLDNVDLSSRVAKTGDTMTGDLIVDANVGIGTSSPLSALDVSNSFITVSKGAATTGRMGASDYIVGGTDNDFVIQSSGTGVTRFVQTSTERMRIDSGGRVTMPYQPIASCSDGRGINLNNVDLNSSNFYDTVDVNRGNHFNASTGRFTCPVSGVYRIFVRVSSSGSGNQNIRLRKNGSTIREAYGDGSGNFSVSGEAIASCSAGDYLHIQVATMTCLAGTQHKQVTFELIG